MTKSKNFKIKYMKIFRNSNVTKYHTKLKVFSKQA